MSADIRLIVGLGNPGPEYTATRHNAGFWFVEDLARQFNAPLSPDSKYFGQTARLGPPYSDTRLLLPMTFMNKSGQAVGAMANFFKVTPEQILVVHDELDLPPGVAKFKQGGGHGGHNGLKDIIRALGNNNNFHRLRIGIGHPGHASQVTGYVLGKAPSQEQQLIDDAVRASLRGVEIALRDGWTAAKQYLHSIKPE
ncbi:aminoacyl-tRNA hydrolase [Aliidiomarina haloalkalitolerans]|uniref:Peptidyl-tRNA hydrolase n=1 Tax=Aliidiomarina haloalkalitolerans TaxID=859059 RepID=A0A432VZ90_9GAMM|nr:aminoacyl-tRNA hydrolase [Aliidiomarina haloalkalitolerans]RUO21981.1 aminoacyl-tRNA hydrolase [Aliidiomarina haloalkalitolerans]